MKKIVVVGSINLDLVATVERMPAPGETITGQQFATYSGGKGANQAVCAALLGGDVSLVGRLGQDHFGVELRNALESAGVETSGVAEVAGPSGTAVILVTAAGGNSIVVIPGANAALRPEDLDQYDDLLGQAAILLTQLEIALETVEQISRIAQQRAIPFVLDPAPARALSPELLRTITWLTPNESECRILLEALGRGGEPETELAWPEAAQRLLDAGVRNVILKLGARGCYIAGQDVLATHVAPFAVEAVDTTAAGDAFNAGFAYGLTHGGLDPLAAARFANAVAAVSVTRAGAQSSMPRLAEVEVLLQAKS